MNDCLFCKIANDKMPSDFIYKDDDVVAFNDINPQAPVHFLVIPKKHIDDITKLEAADDELLAKITRVICRLAKEQGLSEGFRIVNNCGENGGQSVKHLHFHVLGRRQMGWPPG